MNYRGAVTVIALVAALSACGAPTEDAADDSSVDSADAAPKPGKITGSLSYPSDYIPDDMQVCAEDTTSKEVTCKGGFKDDSFEMELPAGTYHVWARTDEAAAGYRAYYNEAVKCGLDISCKDRTAIDVEVKPGQTIAKIDPADWYNYD